MFCSPVEQLCEFSEYQLPAVTVGHLWQDAGRTLFKFICLFVITPPLPRDGGTT